MCGNHFGDMKITSLYTQFSTTCRLTGLLLLLLPFGLASCGRVYFPMELKTVSRTDRIKGQEEKDISLIPMTTKNIQKANLAPYVKYVIDAGDLRKPAKSIPADLSLKEKLPQNNNPGPYVIGLGDELTFAEILGNGSSVPTFISRKLIVSDDGFINIFQIGRIKAEGLTQSQLEDLIYTKLLEKGKEGSFELAITGFNSKRIYLSGENVLPRAIPYTSNPIYLGDVFSLVGINKKPGSDVKVSILRNGKEYVVSLVNIAKNLDRQLRLFPNDKIFFKPINYRVEAVLIVGETGGQQSFPITSFQRPTLADTIFSGTVLNNITSDFSQIYVLREKNKEFNAYHLDITNPSRIKLAKKFEMRPDDIVFVAAQPLTLYSRTLSQILGSVGITQQARDQVRSEFNLNSN
jgi:polysaccharide export outer membrane protein